METTALSPIAESAPKPALRAEVRPLRAIRRSYRRNLAQRNRLQRTLFGLFFFLLGTYALNALILFLFAPQGIESGSSDYEGASAAIH